MLHGHPAVAVLAVGTQQATEAPYLQVKVEAVCNFIMSWPLQYNL